MEKIKINDMQTKGVVFIVKYQSYDTKIGAVGLEQEATLNINFNAISITYLKNEVGIGGTVLVEIKNKPKNPLNESEGFWVNITKVDMTSGIKGGVEGKFITESEKIVDNDIARREYVDAPQTNLMSAKDVSITAQCLTKCYGYGSDRSPQDILEAYRFFVLELENNG